MASQITSWMWNALVNSPLDYLGSSAAADSARARRLLMESAPVSKYRVLWVDGVGGYLLVDRDEVVIGQAIAGSDCDICIVGDLSRQAGAIRRSEADYLLLPLQATELNGAFVERAQLLRDGDTIQLSSCVELAFRKPNPLSATARLELLGPRRFQPNIDAVLLLADSCILGPKPGSHVRCPHWGTELRLFRHAAGWSAIGTGPVEVNGVEVREAFPLSAGMRVRGQDYSLSIE